MSEINYFKVWYYARLCDRWCNADLAIDDDVTIDDVYSLHVNKIT
jgi:hypothetical protein